MGTDGMAADTFGFWMNHDESGSVLVCIYPILKCLCCEYVPNFDSDPLTQTSRSTSGRKITCKTLDPL